MRLPAAAIGFYIGLGANRSYQRVAEEFRVTRQAVARRAKRDNWQADAAKADEEARRRAVQDAVESLADMNARHLKICQLMQKKALESLRASGELTTMEAIRALGIAVEQERAIRMGSETQPLKIVIGGSA